MTVSISACCVGKKWRSEPVLTPARAATARTLSREVGSSPSIVAAAIRIFSRVLCFVGSLIGRHLPSVLSTLCYFVDGTSTVY